MRRPAEFEATVRGGRRRGTGSLVVHLSSGPVSAGAPMVGIVVGKRVGGAVTRNKVKRRIRALAAARVAELPCGAGLVVRALPRAAGVSFGMLERDFATAVEAVMERSREVRR